MDLRKLLLNAGLAGFWAAAATLTATGEISVAAGLAALAIGIRVAAGYVAAQLGAPVPVDK